MHIELAPDAPIILKTGAATLLAAHIGGGSLGITSGFAAALARKGGVLHRRAGTVFFASMLTMTTAAAITAPLLPEGQAPNTVAALFTFYLVLSAWLTVRRRPGQTGRAERALAAMPVALAVAAVGLAVWGTTTGQGALYGVLFMFGAVMALSAFMDIRTLRRGGLIGPERTRRHLWRMCAALFVASGSFFLGQQRVMPEAWRGLPIWFVPALAPLALLIFWMIRTRARRLRPPSPAAAPA